MNYWVQYITEYAYYLLTKLLGGGKKLASGGFPRVNSHGLYDILGSAEPSYVMIMYTFLLGIFSPDEERIGAKPRKRVQHFDQFFGASGGQRSFSGKGLCRVAVM